MAVILGGLKDFPVIFLSKSQTFVPPLDGNVCIHVIGAGGSGSASNSASFNGAGGAGGYCKKNSLAVTTSSSFTVVIGAGHKPTQTGTAGGNGGNSTVAGTGLSATLTANGGTGHDRTDNASTAPGGAASNGDVNNTGGAGGKFRGGGAVGIGGTGAQGFDAGGVPGSGGQCMGGSCDVIGDLWRSSLGEIAGGLPGVGVYDNDGAISFFQAIAGPLSGGGSSKIGSGYCYPVGGAALIGGGGGSAQYADYGALGGRGGQGLVIFQYIP